MKILARYILKEFLPPFSIALICFTCILIFDDLFRLTKLFVQKGISPLYLVELLFYVMPATIVLSIPMASLVAILLALGRLSTDNEIVAMKAHGVAFHHLMLPLLAITVVLSLVDLLLMDVALPHANRAYSTLKRDIQKHNPTFVLEESTVMKELEREGKLWMYDSMNTENERMQNVKIWDGIWSGRPRFSHAEEGTLGFEEGRAVLTLYNGHSYEPSTDDSDGYRVTQFQQQQLALQLTEDLERGESRNKTPRSMRIGQLKTFIATLQGTVETSKNREFAHRKVRFAQVEYYKKFAIPFACLAFGLMGVPLGLMVRQGGRMIGFGIGLVVILVYYLLLQVGQSTGLNGVLSPALAMWLPNIAIAALGVFLSVLLIGEGRVRMWRERTNSAPVAVNTNADAEL